LYDLVLTFEVRIILNVSRILLMIFSSEAPHVFANRADSVVTPVLLFCHILFNSRPFLNSLVLLPLNSVWFSQYSYAHISSEDFIFLEIAQLYAEPTECLWCSHPKFEFFSAALCFDYLKHLFKELAGCAIVYYRSIYSGWIASSRQDRVTDPIR
jgi:hypothetical protein